MIDIRLLGQEKELVEALELIEKLSDEGRITILRDCTRFYPNDNDSLQRAYLLIGLADEETGASKNNE